MNVLFCAFCEVVFPCPLEKSDPQISLLGGFDSAKLVFGCYNSSRDVDGYWCACGLVSLAHQLSLFDHLPYL